MTAALFCMYGTQLVNAFTWSTETIDAEGAPCCQNSVVLDSTGKIHISYCDSSDYSLKYAVNASGSWEITSLN